MSQAQAAAGSDRLPWLEDEPTPRAKHGPRGGLVGLTVFAALILTGFIIWMVAHSSQQPARRAQINLPGTTVALPQARPAQPPQPQVVFEPAPQVSPIKQRDVIIAKPRIVKEPVRRAPSEVDAPAARSTQETSAPTPPPAATTAAQPAKPAQVAAERPLTAWPAWQSQGAYGRIVRVGAFGNREQAKLGWRYMVQAYPAVARLNATVVGDRNSRGRHFYRFQIGTTSQAHSEVLCQRMEKIRLSCAVVGLPWSPKGVER